LDQLGGRLRAVFDMGNFVLGGYEPIGAYELLREHIEYFHIKDALARGAIVPAGKGEARIGEILADFRSRTESDFFISLEPHLETFAGLKTLTSESFENPYKYADQKAAFADAVAKINQVLEGI
jgi:sugar phosphate isomerase/epimerase